MIKPPTKAESEQDLPARQASAAEKMDVVYAVPLLLLAFLLGSFLAQSSDTWWYLAVGREIAHGDYPFGKDPFAIATDNVGRDIPTVSINHAWLPSLVFYSLYDGEQGWLLGLFKALLGVALAMVYLFIRKTGRNGWMGTVCLLLMFLTLSARWLLEPAVFSLFFLGITLAVLYWAGALGGIENPRPRLLWLLPALFVLWVNCDAWFLLGPVVVLLAAIGTFLGKRFQNKPCPVRQQGLWLVAAIGLLACLLNPYGILAFELPGELRTLTIGPFSTAYWGNNRAGRNVAGFAFLLLLALSAASFLIRYLASADKNNGGFPVPRLLVWIPFTILAALDIRLIGYFAVAAGLITMLNFQEHLAWRETTSETCLYQQTRWSSLATVLFGPTLLLLLIMAWPGWLNDSIGTFSSPRRVAWGVYTDPHLKQAALFLNREQETDRLKRGFNSSRHIVNYCTWFAPGIKYYIDHTTAPSPEKIQDYQKASESLSRMIAGVFESRGQNPALDALEWQDVFRKYDLDHIAVPSQNRLNELSWLRGNELVSVYDDGEIALLKWNGAVRTRDVVKLSEKWRRQVFVDEVADAKEIPPVGEAPGFWSWYSQGRSPEPVETSETLRLLQVYPIRNQWQKWRRPVDPGQPELPVLALRTARKGLRQKPRSVQLRLLLTNSLHLLNTQENHWVAGSLPGHAPDLPQNAIRHQLRDIQYVTALQQVALLQPDNSEIHWELALFYERIHYLDIALEHIKLSLYYLNNNPPADLTPQQIDKIRQERQGLYEFRAADLARRMQSYDSRTLGASDARKFEVAILEPDPAAAPNTDPRLGLAKLAASIVGGIVKRGANTTPQEKIYAAQFIPEYLLFNGDPEQMASELQLWERNMAPLRYQQVRLFHSASIADYGDADDALARAIDILKKAHQQEQQRMGVNLAVTLLGGSADLGTPTSAPLPATGLIALRAEQRNSDYYKNEIAEYTLLRGLMALEAGKPQQAETFFHEVLQLVAAGQLADRAIAERYLKRMKHDDSES